MCPQPSPSCGLLRLSEACKEETGTYFFLICQSIPLSNTSLPPPMRDPYQDMHGHGGGCHSPRATGILHWVSSRCPTSCVLRFVTLGLLPNAPKFPQSPPKFGEIVDTSLKSVLLEGHWHFFLLLQGFWQGPCEMGAGKVDFWDKSADLSVRPSLSGLKRLRLGALR